LTLLQGSSRGGATIVALVGDPSERGRVLEALGPFGDVRFCELAGQIVPLVEALGPLIVVSEMFDTAGQRVGPALERLRELRPELPVVILVTPRATVVHEAFAIAALFASAGTVVQGIDDIAAVAERVVAHSRSRSVDERIRLALIPLVPVPLEPFFTYCAGHGGHPMQIDDAATTSRIARRTLDERLRRASLPTAEEIIGWHRILHAAWALDQPGHTVERVAHELEFSAPSALRNLYRRHLGRTPSETRDGGGFDTVLGDFRERLRRGAHRSSRATPQE
jgi:AraC-like DNA-binding protein